MNIRQKVYDSTDEENKLIKINNNYYLYKNVEQIKNRKVKSFGTSNPNRIPSRYNRCQNYKDYFIIKENLLVYNKIRNIMNKKVSPQNNNYFITHENKSKENKNKYKNLEDMKIAEENKNFYKRLQSQKSFINVNKLDKEYQKGRKLCKTNAQAQSVVLPPINFYKISLPKIKPAKKDELKKRCATEANLDEKK